MSYHKKRPNTYKHGHAYNGKISPTYWSWRGMVKRCTEPNNASYKRYGGRGIKVCKRWRSFINFLKDMGVRPIGKSLERKNSNGNYTKSNCRWATSKEQSRNTCRVVKITHNSVTLCIRDWEIKLGFTKHTINRRRAAGKTGAALFAPIRKHKPYKNRK